MTLVKKHFVFIWLKLGKFQPKFDKTTFFINIIKPFMDKCKTNLKFIEGVHFERIEKIPNDGTKYLLIFDDSCEKTSNFKKLVENKEYS